jgi:hypothetical protein
MKLMKKSVAIVYPGLILASSVFFLVYVILNAGRVSFSHDEATTFLNYLSGDIFQLFNFISPNNHFLNTVLAKIFYVIGGNREWVLRLPNVLAYVMYLVFSFLLVHKWTQKTLAAAGFLLLNLNPYVLDFFSLCRGYGLSMAFMVAGLYFYVPFLNKRSRPKTSGAKDLSWSLGMVACAVLANLALLNVYVGLVFFTLVLTVASNRKNPGPGIALPVVKKPSLTKKILVSAFILFALFFNIVLVGQDLIFSERFTEPVTVKISGPPLEASVYGMSLFHGEVPFVYQNGLWRLKQEFYLSAIRLRIPLSFPDKIEAAEIRIGPHVFQVTSEQIQKWKSDQNNKYFFLNSDDSISLKRATFPHLRSVINWGGDRPFFLSILGRAALVIILFAAIFGLVLGLGRLLERWAITTGEQLRPLVSATFMLTALVAYPIYLFRKYQAFVYWESDQGFIQDTILSLIRSSLYGQERSSGLVFLILSLVLLSFALFLVLFFFSLRQKTFSKIRTSFFLLAVLFLSALSTIGQNILFQTPYLYERTAVFFIPLYMLFLIFFVQSLAESHPRMNIPAASLFILLTLLGSFHFSQTANTLWVQDWKFGADTKDMLEELKQLREKDSIPPEKIRLGIHWLFSPAINYYRMKESLSWLEFGLVSKPGQIPNYDYCYLPPELMPEKDFLKKRKISIIKKYKISGNFLLKTEKTIAPRSP